MDFKNRRLQLNIANHVNRALILTLLLILITGMFSIPAYAKTSAEWVVDGNRLLEMMDYTSAIEAYDKATDINPNNGDAWYNKATALSDLGQYEDAITAYDKAIALNPDDADAWFDKGYALDELGQYEEAIKAYDKALIINQNDGDAWYNKGIALDNLGRYEEAIKAYDKATNINPDDAGAWYNKGIVLDSVGRYDEAIKAYDKATDLDPNYVDAWYNKGIALDNLGRYEEAIKAYDKATDLDPNYVDAWYNKGIVLDSVGRYDEAIKAYGKATDLDSNDGDAWYNKATALSDLGQYEDAITAYDKAIALNPDDADAWFDKGIALDSLERYDEAKEAYKMAGDLDPFYSIFNILFSEIAIISYFIIFVLIVFYLLKKIIDKMRKAPLADSTLNSHSAKKSNDITKMHDLTSESSHSPSNVTASPTITSAFGYKGATIQYKVKVENPTSEPIADIKINLYVPDVFLASESIKTISMLKPSESKTVTFEIRPTGECGDCEVSGKVVYYDYSTKKTTGIDIPPKSLSIVCPMLKMKEISESEWHNIVSSFVETEESTREIDMPAETLFTMISRIVKDMHMHPLNPEITNSQQLYDGVARFYGEGAKGLKYAAQVEVVGGVKKSRLILKTWAEKEEALTGFYHGLLDEIEKRVHVKGYIDDSIVQNFHHYGDKIGTQVKDSVVQRSTIGTDVVERKCPECGIVAEGNGKFCNGCGGKL